ncbi:carboxymuconolactone decarboxylase family protein [Longibaculum muris]|uniref:carboxymuconolactone decarboxylase family protein n=1 Tax=Longibaculum muris TaxID=1796628 RepID=UPI0022E19F29|nr:carboxymuconolactone decarboxylase family protein [Longibaculum muris]
MRDLNKANELFQQLHDEDILNDDLELQTIMKNYIYGDIYQHGTLDLKLRELILIVVNTTNHTLTALKEHVNAAIKAEVSPIQIKEVIYQCTPYIGLGKVQDALEVVNLIFKKHNISTKLQATVNEKTRFEKGFEVQSVAFGKDHIQANHDQAPQELKHIQKYLSEYCFGDFYTREGLDLKTRELMTMVMLATLGGCENQLRGHVGANITVGNSRELLIETITQCQPYIGFPRMLNAITIINEVTK